MTRDQLLEPTALLDYRAAGVASLIRDRGWAELARPFDRIGAVYAFVRDEIAFGYNRSDDIPASEVVADRYGQCNTKATLLMALLRAVGVQCRLQGATIHKRLQTEIQAEGIARRFGAYSCPDEFYAVHRANLNFLQRVVYGRVIRHRLNRKVAAIRSVANHISKLSRSRGILATRIWAFSSDIGDAPGSCRGVYQLHVGFLCSTGQFMKIILSATLRIIYIMSNWVDLTWRSLFST